MKKQLLLFIGLVISVIMQAQVTKTVNVTTPGSLYYLLPTTERNTVTNLTVTGTLNDSDFVTMRESMDKLSILDLSTATVVGNEMPTSAFEDCTNLTSVILPNTVTYLGTYTFSGCCNLTSVILPYFIDEIPYQTFSGCKKLSSLTIPPFVTYIESVSLWGCNSLSEITIPASVTKIDEDVFRNSILITVDPNNQYYSSMDGVLFDKAKTTLIQCSKFKTGSYKIPSTVTIISDYAFENCKYLASISIPSSVTSIGYSAFAGCNSLTSITIPSSITTIRASAFSGCSNLSGTITIPSLVTTIESNTFEGCTHLTSIDIPSSVTSIEGNIYFCSGCSPTIFNNTVFNNCSALINVNANNTVYSSVNGVLFCKDKTFLLAVPTSITGNYTVPSTVTTIGCSFEYNTSISSITIPSSVNSLKNQMSFPFSIFVDANNTTFSSMDGVLFNKDMTKLICCPTSKTGIYSIPSTVTNIKSAFRNCSNLTSVTIPSSVTNMDYAFLGCTGLTSVTIPSSVKDMNAAFEGCTGLISLTIPTSATNLGSFDGCSNLSFISLPSSANYLGTYRKCVKLTSITIPSSISKIESFSFQGCTGLTSLTIPSTVSTIGFEAFQNCSSLSSLVIPSSLNALHDQTFENCSGLTSIYSNSNTPAKLDSRVFFNVDKNNCVLYVPIGSKSIYQGALGWRDFKNIVETSSTSGIESIDFERELICPNPVKTSFNVNIEGDAIIQVYSLKGILVLSKKVTGKESISLNNLVAGIYEVRIVTNKNVKTQKIVVE